MVLVPFSLALSFLPFLSPVHALKFSVKQFRKPTGPVTPRSLPPYRVLAAGDGNNGLDINTAHDLLYMAEAQVGGKNFTVQLDTGSSDLWVKNDPFPVPNSKQTDLKQNLTYGIGWVSGLISTSDVEFAGITVPNQSYLDVQEANNPALGYGAQGLLGLGFTSLSSIDHRVNETGGSHGRSFLYNMFRDKPSEPNFIAFSLQRSTAQGAEGDVEGTFSIGEYEPKYKAVAQSPKIPTWPVHDPKRWNVLIDAILFADGRTVIPKTHVPDAPGNKAVALLDSGTSWTYAPTEIAEAIYGNIPGAQLDTSIGQWIVPCDAEIDIAFQINGQILPVHPLDLIPRDDTANRCLGSVVPQSFEIGAGQFDWLVGDNFLRSVYSLYDFGDFDENQKMGNPYVQLLSLVNPDTASKDFVKSRGGSAKSGISYKASEETMAAPTSTSVTLSADVANTISKIGQFFPAVLGLVALNALVLLGLIILGIVLLCRKKRKNSRKPDVNARLRTPLGRMSPMPLTRPGSSAGNNESHTYEPVSMAMTEDTLFVAPSPKFHKYDGSRPKSYAATVRSGMQSMYIDTTNSPEDAVFGPPSPGFRQFEEGSSTQSANVAVPLVPIVTSPPSSNNPYKRLEDAQEASQPEPTTMPFTPPRPAHLRPNAEASKGDRPMSVGVLPSQQSPYLERDGKFSRSQDHFQQRQVPTTEEDITLNPPHPNFFAENTTTQPGASSNDNRPTSLAL